MDVIKNLGGKDANTQQTSDQSGGGLLDTLHGAVGGGRQSEKNEDGVDKGVDFVQEKFMGAGPQDNESALEQAKDEKISDFVRGQYKSATGSEVPIKDK
ncbi:hypothetical protein BZA05DRAFT_346879 [Tricharina praecox]|uniref:uncharacterized protein n=1 Tax=Tricharina praecox TaxID=43433 RepID=UPI00222119B4|nr:uncharacterized protein BZA05DRAFT_346879 [Tricharina praecox]KAI5857563.1 hypothetical protein BZA05DRAFT_346879 [Tricharina praecox]